MKKRIKVPGIWIGLLALYIVSVILAPSMLSTGHLLNLMQIASFLGVVALGQTFVILAGGVDLSVSGVIMMTNVLICYYMNGDPGNTVLALAICFAAAIAAGVVNGVLITKFKVIPLICTLAMSQILFGLALIFTGGIPRGSVGAEFSVIGTGRVFSVIPVSFLIWLALTIGLHFMLKKTVFGRQVYAVGANSRAAWAAGISAAKATIKVYVVSALMAAVTGLLISAYVNIPSFGVGDPYSLNSIVAVVVGGTLLTGGVGSVLSTAGGVLFISQINSLTNVLNVSTGGQYLIQAAIIIIGVASTRSGITILDNFKLFYINITKKIKKGVQK